MKHKHMQAFTGLEPICDFCGKLFANENEECPGKPTPVPKEATVTITEREYDTLRNIANEANWMHGQGMLMTRTMLDWLGIFKTIPKK